jgi:hypothetical protein
MSEPTTTERRIRAKIMLEAVSRMHADDLETLPDVDLQRVIAGCGTMQLRAESILRQRGCVRVSEPTTANRPEILAESIIRQRGYIRVVDGGASSATAEAGKVLPFRKSKER